MEKTKVLVGVTCMLVVGLIAAQGYTQSLDLYGLGVSFTMPVARIEGGLKAQIYEFGTTVATIFPSSDFAEIMKLIQNHPATKREVYASVVLKSEILERVMSTKGLLDSERIDPAVAEAMARGFFEAPDKPICLKIATTEDVTDVHIGELQAAGLTNIVVYGPREIYADLTPRAFFAGAGRMLAECKWIVSRKERNY